MSTAGKVAFEAYCRSRHSASESLVWEKVPDHVKRAWEVVAEHAARNAGPRGRLHKDQAL